MQMMPFWANYHYHLAMQFKTLKTPSYMRSEILADTMISEMEEIHQLLEGELVRRHVTAIKICQRNGPDL